MIEQRRRRIRIISRLYPVGALIAIAVLSPPNLSIIPMALFVAYLFLWRWPLSPTVSLLLTYFIYFAAADLLTPSLGDARAYLAALPVLAAFMVNLEEAALNNLPVNSEAPRRPTYLAVALIIIAFATTLVALMANSLPTLAAGITAMILLALLLVTAWRKMPLTPVVTNPARPDL